VSQSHGKTLWREPPHSGGTPTSLPYYFVKSGADWLLDDTGPEDGALFLIGSDYYLIDLTPVLGVYYDSGGNPQAIDPLVTPRLHAIFIYGNVIFY
jgi:hypothetical protein